MFCVRMEGNGRIEGSMRQKTESNRDMDVRERDRGREIVRERDRDRVAEKER